MDSEFGRLLDWILYCTFLVDLVEDVIGREGREERKRGKMSFQKPSS